MKYKINFEENFHYENWITIQSDLTREEIEELTDNVGTLKEFTEELKHNPKIRKFHVNEDTDPERENEVTFIDEEEE